MAGSDRIKAPLKTGVARVRSMMQMEDLECGATCLRMVLAYYGKWVSSESIRHSAGVSRNGSRAGRMVLAARGFGLDAEGYRMDIDTLREQGTFPCILFLNYHHFVVLKGFRKGKAYINDPAWGSYVMPVSELESVYGGMCIFLSPSESFETGGMKNSILSLVIGELGDNKNILIFLFIMTVTMSVLGLLRPTIDMIFIDRVMNESSPQWDRFFYTALILISVLKVLCTLIQSIYHLSLQKKLAVMGSMNYMWHVMRLPADFFTQRSASDILRRRSFNEKIAFDFVSRIMPFVMDVVLMFCYLFVMMRFSIYLGLVGLAAILLNVLLGQYLVRSRLNSTRVIEREEGLFSSMTSNGIDIMDTIKSCGAESGFFRRWSGCLTAMFNRRVEAESTLILVGSLPEFVNTLCSALVITGGVILIMRGRLGTGTLVACIGYFDLMSRPAKQLIETANAMTELTTQVERVSDVIDHDTEDIKESTDLSEGKSHGKLSGRIDISNLNFAYSEYEKPVINDFSLKIKPGECIAVTGRSGSGKSTLSKLIAGLYDPQSGEILFDGKKRSEIEGGVFTDCVALVQQENGFFNDTLANNIKMYDDTIENYEVILAALDARLHEEIMYRPGGYECCMTGGGSNFSGGQRQRLEIASALCHDPTVIILDESTSALDAVTEKKLLSSIRERGNTCILIAHRLSTTRSCDRIVVMEEGRIAEMGTYEELMEKQGLYYELVRGEEPELS